LLVPQLLENYRNNSAEGVSLLFLFVWLIGDITNLSGAIWASLVPTVVALGIFFCFADFILISQCLYYNYINARKSRQQSVISTCSEQEPLLTRSRSSDTIGLPGSHRRRSTAGSGRTDSLAKISEEEENGAGNPWLRNSLSILGVIAAGTAGWAIAWKSGVWTPTPLDGDIPEAGATQAALGAEILGYASALCYLGARIPQIIMNHKDKSTKGLALLFFLLSLIGNTTYGISILCHSLERDYLTTNLPWLIGSLGTIAEDVIIFIQFKIYASKPSTTAVE